MGAATAAAATALVMILLLLRVRPQTGGAKVLHEELAKAGVHGTIGSAACRPTNIKTTCAGCSEQDPFAAAHRPIVVFRRTRYAI